jgi:outer membrane lipoprotein-sorting protein
MRYATKDCLKPFLFRAGPAFGSLLAILCHGSFLLLLSGASLGDDKLSADQALAQLDRMRLPPRSFTVDLAMADFRQGKKEREGTFRLYCKRTSAGFDSLAVCRSPAPDRDKLLLSRGEKLWFYDPKAARAVPVSSFQFRSHSFVLDLFVRLLGLNYSAELEGEGSTTDLARRQITAQRLRLTPRKDGKAGEFVRYWLDKENSRPLKSEMLGSAGKLLRTVYYGEFRNVLGEQRPTRLIVVNPMEGSVHEVKLSNFAARDTPDPVFDETLLPRALTLLR